LRKSLGRLAGAVLAGALITITTAPAALADDASTTATPPTSVSEETSTPSEPASTTTDAPSTTPTSTSTSTSTSSVTTTPTSSSSGGTSTSVEPTSSKPSETTTEPTTTTPEAPPYVDDVGFGIDFGNGYGAVVIACAAGEPTNLRSADFDVVEGPYQEEQDGRYWDFVVQLHDGKTFASGTITADWECGPSMPQGGGASGGGAPVTPVAGSEQAAAWQQGNGGKAQVSFAPRAGVETGFGGTAGD
jgi:hypothetical protein